MSVMWEEYPVSDKLPSHILEYSLENKWLGKQKAWWLSGFSVANRTESWLALFLLLKKVGAGVLNDLPGSRPSYIFLLVIGIELEIFKILHLASSRFSNAWPLPCHPASCSSMIRYIYEDNWNFKFPTFIASKSNKKSWLLLLNHQPIILYQVRSCDNRQWSVAPLSLKASQQFYYKIFWGS